MSASDGLRFTVTCEWRIENFSFALTNLRSPAFVPNSTRGTTWTLIMCRTLANIPRAALQSKPGDAGLGDLGLEYELSLLDPNGSPLGWVDHRQGSFRKDGLCPELNFSRDVLTVRCRMWKGSGCASEKEEEFFFRTRIGVERMTFTGVVKNFSLLSPGPKSVLCAENPLISMHISLTDEGKIELGIKAVETEDTRLIKCRLFLVDTTGSRVRCGNKEFFEVPFRRLCRLLTRDRVWKIPLTLNKTELMLRGGQYLPNDVLSLQCGIAYSTGIESNVVQNFKSTSNGVSGTSSMNLPGPSCQGRLTGLTDDLVSLSHAPVCCDAETFSADGYILSTKFSVFRAMLNDCINGCVNVSDLKLNVVLRMLLFLCTDDLGEVNWDVARDLYLAAATYQVPSLKHKSALRLQEEMQVSNCCDVLVLADEHQDADLKTSAQQYIVKHSLDVFGTEAWRGLETDYPRLALEIFRIMCFGH